MISPDWERIAVSWKTYKQARKTWLLAPVRAGGLLLNVGIDQLLGKKGNPGCVRALCPDKLLAESKWTAENKWCSRRHKVLAHLEKLLQELRRLLKIPEKPWIKLEWSTCTYTWQIFTVFELHLKLFRISLQINPGGYYRQVIWNTKMFGHIGNVLVCLIGDGDVQLCPCWGCLNAEGLF